MFSILAVVVSILLLGDPGTATDPINLDFEAGALESGFPVGWDGKLMEYLETGGAGYDVVVDTDVRHGGEASAHITLVGEQGYPPQGVVLQTIPVAGWEGRALEVSAFMKTEDVQTDAGLLLVVVGETGVLAYEGMGDRAVTGTTDWTEYAVTVFVAAGATEIGFGAWLDGEGAVWVDDFRLVEGAEANITSSEAATVGSPPTDSQVAWLRDNAVAFETAEAGNGFADLEPLREMIGDARIVALGEGTHGTREFFQMKHRLLEFLASEMGFTIFSIEASTPEAYAINPYVRGGDGDPAALIGGMYFWTWNTEEVLAMVEWMREFNAAGHDLQFTGFDMQAPDVAMENVTEFLRKADPQGALGVDEDYAKLRAQKPAGGFGVATMTFPVDAARGKTIRYTGYIRTEDLADGWAGLWWRVDGPDKQMRAFDNMQANGPRGTTGWTMYTVELPVAEDAVNINFGVLMPGYGKAWFDGLHVEIDGEPFDATTDFDFDFEAEKIEGYYASSGGSYQATLDPDVYHSGAQSLRLESLVAREEEDEAEAVDAPAVSRAIAERLESRRDEYVAATSAEETEWALHNARIVNQCMRMRHGSDRGLVRDASMAENISWILEQNPGAKIVLWAHNGHIQRKEDWMGAHLADVYGEDYVAIGFTAGHGEYTAMKRGRGLRSDNPLLDPPAGSVESFFESTGQPRLILDLRRADAAHETSAWLSESRLFRSIGALAMDKQFHPDVVADRFDILIYFRDTTAAVQLTSRPGKRGGG